MAGFFIRTSFVWRRSFNENDAFFSHFFCLWLMKKRVFLPSFYINYKLLLSKLEKNLQVSFFNEVFILLSLEKISQTAQVSRYKTIAFHVFRFSRNKVIDVSEVLIKAFELNALTFKAVSLYETQLNKLGLNGQLFRLSRSTRTCILNINSCEPSEFNAFTTGTGRARY